MASSPQLERIKLVENSINAEKVMLHLQFSLIHENVLSSKLVVNICMVFLTCFILIILQRGFFASVLLLNVFYLTKAIETTPNTLHKDIHVNVPAVESNGEFREKRTPEESVPLGEVTNISESKDLETAETIVFRPFFGYRYRLAHRRPFYRRRYYRSVDGQDDDLKADEIIFRPLFRRRLAYPRHFPYYYYYY